MLVVIFMLNKYHCPRSLGAAGSISVIKMFTYNLYDSAFIIPSMKDLFLTPFAAIEAQTMILPPPCFIFSRVQTLRLEGFINSLPHLGILITSKDVKFTLV